jgi:hypothetical protein
MQERGSKDGSFSLGSDAELVNRLEPALVRQSGQVSSLNMWLPTACRTGEQQAASLNRHGNPLQVITFSSPPIRERNCE